MIVIWSRRMVVFFEVGRFLFVFVLFSLRVVFGGRGLEVSG